MMRYFLPVTVIALGTVAYAQNSTLAGDYAGMLGPYHVKLHLILAQDGGLTGTADNSDLGLSGAPCANIRAEGQTLSFTVPTVGGTWTGFVSADRNSLSGMWTQGANPMPLNFTRSSGGSQGGATSRPTGANAEGEVKWDDYVFKFMPGGNMAQVYQGSKLVGTIVTVNGQQRVIALPGVDSARLQKSYQDYQAFNARSHGEAPPTTTAAATTTPSTEPAVPSASNPAPPKGAHIPLKPEWDDTTRSITVPMSDGQTFRFNADHTITIGGPWLGGDTWTVMEQKGSVGGFLRTSLTPGTRVHAGGASSLAGGGPKIVSSNGITVYDDVEGVVYAHERNDVKVLAIQILKASDAVKDQLPGHAKTLDDKLLKQIKNLSELR